MSKRSKAPVAQLNRKAAYQAYYGITLIETLMSVGLLGVVLIPLLMTSTAYLSTKLLKHRSTTELSQNVNALGSKLNTLAASTTGVNPLTSTATNVELMIKTPSGGKRIFRYNIIGTPGSQRLREFQGVEGDLTSNSAMRSLNEDSVTLLGSAGFSYCSITECTKPTDTDDEREAIIRQAEVLVFDGNSTTPVTRSATGAVGGAEAVGLLYSAGDNSRKRTFLPTNLFPLGIDSQNNILFPNETKVKNKEPKGLLNVFTKPEVYGSPNGGGAVDADLTLTTGSGSSFIALPLANVVPAAPVANQTSRAKFSRIYKEGKGDFNAGNLREILPSFRLDQTVAESFQGNMCFSGNRQLDDAFQVYYWNRTMSQAALTSVQSLSTVADPFALTPECVGHSTGYGVYDPSVGTHYIEILPRLKYGTPKTTVDTNVPTALQEWYSPWVEPVGQVWDTSKEAHYFWYAWDTTSGSTSPTNQTYFYTDAKWDWKNCGFGQCQALTSRNWKATTFGDIIRPEFTTTITADGSRTENQAQYVTPNGFHLFIHERANEPLLSTTAARVDVVDPFASNQPTAEYLRTRNTFSMMGDEPYNFTHGGDQGSYWDRQCDWTPITAPYHNSLVHSVCSEIHEPANVAEHIMKPLTHKITFTHTASEYKEFVWHGNTPDVVINGHLEEGISYPFFIIDEFIVEGGTRHITAPQHMQLHGFGRTEKVGSVISLDDYDLTVSPTAFSDLIADGSNLTVNILGWRQIRKVSGNHYTVIAPQFYNYASFDDFIDPGPAYISEGATPTASPPVWASVPGLKRYVNPTPTTTANDTINSTGLTPPYIIREPNDGYMFYNKVGDDGFTRLFSFDPHTQLTVQGPSVNADWGSIATSKLTAGKRVLSYSHRNRLAVTGSTNSASGFGPVWAWYYDDVNLPVAKINTGGTGFNAAQVNNSNVNYIADFVHTLNAYQTNLTAVASEGNTLYTLNGATGTLTRYVTPIGQSSYVRQSETVLTSGIVATDRRSAIAPAPLNNGLYLLNAATKQINFYADRFLGTSLPTPTQPSASDFFATEATTPTGLAVSKATGIIYVLDSTIGTMPDPTDPLTNIRTLNINAYEPDGTFIRPLAFDVSSASQFVNAADYLVPHSDSNMKLTLDEGKSQFYVHVEAAGRVYQFGVADSI